MHKEQTNKQTNKQKNTLLYILDVSPFSLDGSLSRLLVLVLFQVSNLANRSSSLWLCLSRIRLWNRNPYLGWSLIIFRWAKRCSVLSVWISTSVFYVTYTVRRSFLSREERLDIGICNPLSMLKGKNTRTTGGWIGVFPSRDEWINRRWTLLVPNTERVGSVRW